MDMDPDKRTLYIGNLDRNVTEEVLYELFLQAGPIDRVNICSNNNDSFRYGFVTYKHEVSIEYALKLYEGICLYKRELMIKKKGARANNNQQSNDFVKHGGQEENHGRVNMIFQDVAEDLRAYMQQRAKSDMKQNFAPSLMKGSWSNRKKPYDRNPRNHFSRFRESRDRHKDKDYGNKMHHNRKNRH